MLWKLRGWLCLLAGGVGLRRGRRDPVQLQVGDAVDLLINAIVVIAFLLIPTGSGLCLAGGTGECPAGPLGLSVGPGGVLLKEGKPWRGVGVNYLTAFLRVLRNPEDNSYREGFRKLGQHHIPFARFMCCGSWPDDYAVYLKDRAEYFRLLDEVVHSAEENGVGLIADLFWTMATAPDVVGEPCHQWGNPQSKTRAFMRTYLSEVVSRYAHSPAIWGWEFGNEYNLWTDKPITQYGNRSPVSVGKGTPPARSERDELRMDMMCSAFAEFANLVQHLDPQHRIASSGHSAPRPAGWHNQRGQSWVHDTPEQFSEHLLRVNPGKINAISMHIHADVDEGFFDKKTGVIELAQCAARGVGKILYLGEIGSPQPNDPAREEREFRALLGRIVASGVPLASYWVYDYPPHEAEFNATFENRRACHLLDIEQTNRELEKVPCPSTSANP